MRTGLRGAELDPSGQTINQKIHRPTSGPGSKLIEHTGQPSCNRVSYNVVSNELLADKFVFGSALSFNPIPCYVPDLPSLPPDQTGLPSHPQMDTAMLVSAEEGTTAWN